MKKKKKKFEIYLSGSLYMDSCLTVEKKTKNLFGSETMNSFFFKQYFSSLDVSLLKWYDDWFFFFSRRLNMTVLVCFILVNLIIISQSNGSGSSIFEMKVYIELWFVITLGFHLLCYLSVEDKTLVNKGF